MKNKSITKHPAPSKFASSYCCPICEENIFVYQFTIHNVQVVRCQSCGLLSNSSSPDGNGFLTTRDGDGDVLNPEIIWTDSETEQDAAISYVELLKTKGLKTASRILLVAPPDHTFASEASRVGWQISQFESVTSLEAATIGIEFDAAVILYKLEKSTDPIGLAKIVHSALKPRGVLMIVTPSLDSTSAKFFGSSWTEWRPENLFYFNKTNIQLFLWRTGFNKLVIQKDRRKYTLSHIHNRAKAFPKTWITRSIKAAYHIVPAPLRYLRLRLPSSGMIITAVREDLHEPQVCSIIIPAYNESETFPILMDAIIAKKLPGGMDKEIIIIESNSKDGTREQVLKYQDSLGIKIILQDKARGKGNAVREGFANATGDILYIQDADLEYDLNDLDALLKPIVKYQAPFVLGSRHGGKWKMREFDGEEGLSIFFNFGHLLFTTLLNTLYGQNMKDPFTMYKIFRRDCIYGLNFESNRFDLDFELIIKLVRKGYTPVEIPVNYRSRSYKEGKKVRVFRDPLTWIRALVKYRFAKITKE